MPEARVFTPDQQAYIVEQFQSGRGALGISKEMGCGPARIQAALRANGAFEAGRRFKGRYSDAQKAEMAAKYAAGATQGQLAAEYGCHRANVHNILKRLGVQLRAPGIQPSEEADAEIRTMRSQGMSTPAIAAELGLPQARVLFRCRALGISERPPRIGQKSNFWKGGEVFRHASGYLYVWTDPGDPLRIMANATGYIVQHRLIMARSLGRPLSRSETVHHINGDRADNRLENLQLRKGKHGAGVAYACQDCGSHNVTPVPLAG